jgi:Zn-dependent protease with chaperone function
MAAVVAVVAFAIAGPILVRALPPAAAVRLLAPAALLTAFSSAFVLGVVAFLWVGQLSQVAAEGDWSAATLSELDPISQWVSIAAGLLLLPAVGWATRTLYLQVRAIVRLYRLLPQGDPLTIVESPDMDAFTLPSGRIVVTSSLRDALTPKEFQILLAHEESHRQHRHTWWCLGVDLAAAINPMLRGTAAAVREATERWADEDAAAASGRNAVASTIARVALLRTGSEPLPATSPAAGGTVVRRVDALLRPAPRMRAHQVALATVLTGAVFTATIAVSAAGEDIIDQASATQAVQEFPGEA